MDVEGSTAQPGPFHQRQPVQRPGQRFLAHVIYSPKTGVMRRWEPAGTYVLTDIVAEVERGLETDDDIIQQWFGADDVLKLLRSAATFDEMADAIRCVCGEFEID